jgi:transposase
MCSGHFTISAPYRKEVERCLKTAQHLGDMRQVNSLLAILAVMDGQSLAHVALVLRVHEKTVTTWVQVLCCYGLQGAPRRKPTGRPPQLTPTQKAALATLIEEGPVKAGFRGACWRSPMIQPMIAERFGVYDTVFSIAQSRTSASVLRKRPLSRIISMNRSGTSGGPQHGHRFCVARKSGRPCCCLAMQRRSRSGAP